MSAFFIIFLPSCLTAFALKKKRYSVNQKRILQKEPERFYFVISDLIHEKKLKMLRELASVMHFVLLKVSSNHC